MGSKVRGRVGGSSEKKAPRSRPDGSGRSIEILHKRYFSKRRFGVELEMSNGTSRISIKRAIQDVIKEDVRCCRYTLSASETVWHVKNDMSCGVDGSDGPSGIEISSRICSGKRDISIVSKVAKSVIECGAKVNDHCGLHVHVDVSDFSESDIGKLLIYWMVVEQVLVFAMPQRRWDNRYCKMLNPNLQNVLIRSYSGIPSEWTGIARLFRPYDGLFSINMAKRRTLNINNFYRALENDTNRRKTVEFRWPEGTLCQEDIKSWVVLFVSFVDLVKSRNYFPSRFSDTDYTVNLFDVLEILGVGHSFNNFFIFDKTLHDARTWLLRRIVENCDMHFFGKQKEIKKQAWTLLNKI